LAESDSNKENLPEKLTELYISKIFLNNRVKAGNKRSAGGRQAISAGERKLPKEKC